MPSAPPRGRNLPAPRDLPPVLDPAAERVPEGRQLPVHRNKLERIGDQIAALSVDLREYVELRIALVKAEIGEKVEGVKAEARKQAKPFVFLAIAGFFALYWIGFTFALIAAGFAWIFGSDPVFGPTFFGILVSWCFLLLCVAIPALIGRGLLQKNEVEAQLKEDAEGVPPRPTRAEIQDQERTHAQQSAV